MDNRCTCGAGPGIETTGLHEPFCGVPSEPQPAALLADLAERLNQKASTLDSMADAERGFGNRFVVARLSGKAEGVRLALSFVEETRRAL